MVLVAGLGLTGQSVLRFYQRMGEPCLAFDTRESLDLAPLQAQFPEMQFAKGQLPDAWLTQFNTVVLSPGIAQTEPWVEKLKILGKEIIGDIELFARAVDAPVIGITGSNGKSSVTTLVGNALKTAGLQAGVGGNIGTPALDLLIDDTEYEVYVLELSSFQLETTYSLQTEASTVLNISEDHMDRYDSLEAYIQAKTRLLDQTALAVLPEDFHLLGVSHPEKVVRFGLQQADTLPENTYGLLETQAGIYLGKGQQPKVPLDALALKGKHHILNALAAMALTEPFAIAESVWQQVLNEFKGLPHRTQWVAEKAGVQWINDSKGTNVGATLTALETFSEVAASNDGKVILLAGGVGKGADFSPLASAVQACKAVILFGQDASKIEQELIQNSEKMPEFPVLMQSVSTLGEAVQAAEGLAEAGDVVLFSPACASFDQFANFVARGEAFEQLVLQGSQE